MTDTAQRGIQAFQYSALPALINSTMDDGRIEHSTIETHNLTKYYGRQAGIVDLSLAVYPGEIFGFLGPNGAGKTTTIRLLLDLIRPTTGSARVAGRDVRDPSARHHIGYLSGEPTYYRDMTGAALLDFLASLRPGTRRQYGNELAERFDLDLTRPIHHLSKGNRQKLGIVQAFFHEPAVVILDEPSSGLDPLAQRTLHSLVRDWVREDRTVFFSSHVLSEVEQVADRVGIVAHSRLLVVEHIAALKARAPRLFRFEFAQPVLLKAFSEVAGLRELHQDGRFISCKVIGPVGALLRAATQHELVNVTSHEPDLEEIFVEYLNEGR